MIHQPGLKRINTKRWVSILKNDRCFLIGHRDAPESIYPVVLKAVEQHILLYGVVEFMVGRRGAFDRMAARAVKQLKTTYPAVRLTLLLSYHPGERKVELPEGFDGSLYPEGQETVPRQLAIVRANRYAADHSGYLIAYAWQPGSNARKLTEWAQMRKKTKMTLIPMDAS